jgi:hypothetical protein
VVLALPSDQCLHPLLLVMHRPQAFAEAALHRLRIDAGERLEDLR